MTLDATAERVEEAGARIGSQLDSRWRIDSLLGIGGMAAVYGASAGDERRAIKVLHPDLARSQRALDRFRREGEVLRTTLHPAVPRVHGEGTTEDGCPYLVMDLLLGETIEARRRRFGGRLAWPEVVRIALVVLEVLEAAHERGVLHRDVKPSNVLWLDDGSIHVIDFGIAKTMNEDEALGLTRTGELPGSLPFMSPEHALGVPSELDARSDLWSLGATMFLLLSGRPVHESPTDVGTLALSASRHARSLGEVEGDLPPGLVAVVDRALAFERTKRFADAAEMRAALLALGDEPLPMTRPRRWPFALAGAAVLATIALGTTRRAPVRVETPPPAAPPAPALSSPPEAEVIPEPVVETPLPAPAPEPVRRRVPKPAAPVVSAAPEPPRCDPPFFVDPATGTRRVKPGC